MTAGDRVIRAGLVVSLTVVTGVAVVISYGHLLDLARSNGEKGASAATLPITVDGLVFAASLVILNAARHRSRPPVLAWIMLLAGIAATLAGNIAHGIEHGFPGAVIAGWPAAVAGGMFHVAIGEIRRGREPETTVADLPPEFEPDPWPEDTPTGLDIWAALATAPPAPPEPPATGGPIDAWFDGTEPSQAADRQEQDETGPEPDETDPETAQAIATARDRFAETIANGVVPSIRAIRREINVGYPRAVKVRAALTMAHNAISGEVTAG